MGYFKFITKIVRGKLLHLRVNYKLMKNKVRFILSVLLIVLTLGSAKSQNIVNENVARKIGTNFISHNSNRKSPTLKLTHTEIGADRQANLYILPWLPTL